MFHYAVGLSCWLTFGERQSIEDIADVEVKVQEKRASIAHLCIWIWQRNDGLSDAVSLVPDWPTLPHPTTGLYPFMMAASLPDINLSTIYELLRYDPHVLAVVMEGFSQRPVFGL